MASTATALAEFLLARIDEDEGSRGHDYWCSHEQIKDMACDCPQRRHLAECEARRRIVDLHRSWPMADHHEYGCTCGFSDHRLAECSCGWRVADEGEFDRPSSPCPTLRALAGVHADHPDFREEWRE